MDENFTEERPVTVKGIKSSGFHRLSCGALKDLKKQGFHSTVRDLRGMTEKI
jgi:hypothetical protein